MPQPDGFGDRLREAMGDMTQPELAELVGCGLRTLVGWLSGANQPLADSVARLCVALDVDPAWLLGID